MEGMKDSLSAINAKAKLITNQGQDRFASPAAPIQSSSKIDFISQISHMENAEVTALARIQKTTGADSNGTSWPDRMAKTMHRNERAIQTDVAKNALLIRRR